MFAFACATAAHADDAWRIIMPFAPGGATDALARMIAEKLHAQSGKTVLVENIAGANGNIGAAAAARAPADGSTMLITSEAYTTVNPILFKESMRYKPSDLAPISLLGEQAAVLVTHPGSGIRTLDDFIRKARSTGISYSSAGIGSTSHLVTGYLASLVPGMKLTHVPYAGGAPAINALLGSHVDAAFVIAGNVLPYVRAGKLVPIAVSGKNRLSQLPEVPTIAESGFPGFAAVGGVVMLVPAATPAATKARLSAMVHEAMNSPDIQKHLQANGFVVLNSTPEEAQAWLARETKLWSDLILNRHILKD
jgi:tripartite-type tricarboxylate transporter receptor subunit TctC